MENLIKFLKENGVTQEVCEKANLLTQEEIQKKTLDLSIDNRLIREGAKNLTAVKALINCDSIVIGDNGIEGFEEQLTEIKKDCAYMFEAGSGGYQPTAGQAPPDVSKMSDKEYFDYIKTLNN